VSRVLVLAGLVVSAAWSGTAHAATARPSASACAVAWNRSATPDLRSSILAKHPRGAFINGAGAKVGTFSWTKAGTRAQTSSVGCGIAFILPSGRTIAVWGAWKGGAVATWAGPVSSNGPVPVPNNTAVHRDGTIGFHG
jgi:hypothetical protein